MGIQVADNFNYQGQKPLDARLSFNTINSMVSVSSAILYDGCLSYVKENKKYYTYDSNNEIDVTLGRWREYQSGGSSSVQDLDDLSDVAITSPTANQVLKWDGTKWVNSNDEGEFIIVQELPSSGKAKAIYLVPNSSQESGNYYDEYIYINSAWEHIGTSQVDLSNYYNKQEVDSALSGKVDKVSGKGLSTEDYSSAEKTKLGNIESGAEVNVINNIKLNGASQTITNKEVDLRVQELPSGGATGQSLVKSSASDYDVEWANTENVQLSEMPTASAEYADKIYQYVGETSQNYVNGKYYKCNYIEDHLCWKKGDSRIWTIGKPPATVTTTIYSDSSCTTTIDVEYAYFDGVHMCVLFPKDSMESRYDRYSSDDYIVYTWQQINVGADIKVNGIAQQFTNGSYDIPVPTKTSDLDNDSDYVTLDDFLIDNQVSENTTYSSSKIESLVGDFDDLTNRPQESDAIDISDLDLPMPAKPTEYPILFDETGTEYQIGLYKRASDGKVKPVWRKYVTFTMPSTGNSWHEVYNLGTNYKIVDYRAYMISPTTDGVTILPNPFESVLLICNASFSGGWTNKLGCISVNMTSGVNGANSSAYAILKYIKTTDEWKEV